MADLRLTVRPLLVTVHFILMKKSRSVDISLPFFPKPEPGGKQGGMGTGQAELVLYIMAQERSSCSFSGWLIFSSPSSLCSWDLKAGLV